MKRAASTSGGAKKAPRVSPEPSKRSLSYSIETDPSEDPATIPSEFLTPRAEDPTEGSYDTDPSEDPATIPPEFLTSREEDSHNTDLSEHSSGTPEEEISGDMPAAPVVEHYVRKASPVSVTDYSSPLSWSSVNQELPGHLYSFDSDVGNGESQTSGWQRDVEEEHISHGSSPDQTRDQSATGTDTSFGDLPA
ncbi:uncharacterized protein LOC132598520 [Lycium barbarum]|uniref:uncharacterized protein LOC132598520 n=1 Tax=Lycium barbarum TaxID=112863 RepID=UPI00293F695C|nr:uncharacterized protein LOC132598520 [Lycium barbarum]